MEVPGTGVQPPDTGVQPPDRRVRQEASEMGASRMEALEKEATGKFAPITEIAKPFIERLTTRLIFLTNFRLS